MGLKNLLLVCFSVSILATAQTIPRDTIPAILSAYSQLSSLSTLVNSLPLLVQQFNSADNFTFLAPTNDAISSWLATNRSQDYIQAAFQYHLLNGTYSSASISSKPVFIPSALTNTSYSNVTGGQRVKGFNDGQLAFGSALNTRSNALSVDIIAFGGVVHTIDKVLELPIGPAQTFVADNLSYFLAAGSQEGFLSTESRPFIDTLFSIQNATYFIANSAKAFANSNNTGLNQTTLEHLANYAVVPRLIYSTGLVNGSQIMTALGVPVLVTVQDGDTYINSAKVTSTDNFVSNGVFHVIDDILDPRNITGPSLPASTTSSTSQHTKTSEAQAPKQVSKGAKAGIGAGILVGVVLAVAGASILLYFKKRSSSSHAENSALWTGRDTRKMGKESGSPLHELTQLETMQSTAELCTNSRHELPQLVTTKSPVELPSGYNFHEEVGRAI